MSDTVLESNLYNINRILTAAKTCKTGQETRVMIEKAQEKLNEIIYDLTVFTQESK